MTRPGDSREELRHTYDYICPHHEDMWNDQGRSQQFQTYFSQLDGHFQPTRSLSLDAARAFCLPSYLRPASTASTPRSTHSSGFAGDPPPSAQSHVPRSRQSLPASLTSWLLAGSWSTSRSRRGDSRNLPSPGTSRSVRCADTYRLNHAGPPRPKGPGRFATSDRVGSRPA